jgi:hypothetical protein
VPQPRFFVGGIAGAVVGAVLGFAGNAWLNRSQRRHAERERAKTERELASKAWTGLAWRLTADLDHIARMPDADRLQLAQGEFSDLQGSAKAAVTSAFGGDSAVADAERKIRSMLSWGVQVAEAAVSATDAGEARRAGDELPRITQAFVDDPIKDVFLPEVDAALRDPQRVVREPASHKVYRDRLDSLVADFGVGRH